MYKFISGGHADKKSDRRIILEEIKTRKLFVVSPYEYNRFIDDGLVVID
jgi:hypothetical protein